MGLEDMMMEIMKQKDKYRKNCRFCISVKNAPIELGFCQFGCDPREVNVVIQCPKDCGTFEEMQE